MSGQLSQSTVPAATSDITLDLLRTTLQLFHRVRARNNRIPRLFDYNFKGLVGNAAGYFFRMNLIEEGLETLRDSLASIGPPLLFSERTALVSYATAISGHTKPHVSIYQEVLDIYLYHAKQNPLDFGDLLSLCTSFYDAGIVFAKAGRFDVASSITRLALSCLDRVLVPADHTLSEAERQEHNTFLAELREWKGEGRFLLALYLVWHTRDQSDYERAWQYIQDAEKEPWSWFHPTQGNLKKAIDQFAPKLLAVVEFGRHSPNEARNDEMLSYAERLGITQTGPFSELWVRH